MDRPDDIARRASDNRFRHDREVLHATLRGLLGTDGAPAPVEDADRAASLAAEAGAAHREAAEQGWAVVRGEWRPGQREALVAVLHALSGYVGSRPSWLIVPGREPQAVSLTSDVVLDNPLGFAAIGEFELVLMDQRVPAGIWLGRRGHVSFPNATTYSWELEVWGTEPWLSSATRALREQGHAEP